MFGIYILLKVLLILLLTYEHNWNMFFITCNGECIVWFCLITTDELGSQKLLTLVTTDQFMARQIVFL